MRWSHVNNRILKISNRHRVTAAFRRLYEQCKAFFILLITEYFFNTFYPFCIEKFLVNLIMFLSRLIGSEVLALERL